MIRTLTTIKKWGKYGLQGLAYGEHQCLMFTNPSGMCSAIGNGEWVGGYTSMLDAYEALLKGQYLQNPKF